MPEAGTARRSKWWLGGTHSLGGDFLSKQPLILAGECIPFPQEIRRPDFFLSQGSFELRAVSGSPQGPPWAGGWGLCSPFRLAST